MDDGEEPLVLSELHDTSSQAVATNSDHAVTGVTRFFFNTYEYDSSDSSDSQSDTERPSPTDTNSKRRAVAVDSNGDLVLTRRAPRHPRRHQPCITIEHSANATPIPDVGLQVWRGACLLSDWLLSHHRSRITDPPSPDLILELGGGVGLVGVAAAMVSGRHVVVTDSHGGALNLAAANVAANAEVVARERARRQWWGSIERDGGRGRAAQQTWNSGSVGGGGGDGRGRARGGYGEGGVVVEVCELDWFDFLSYGEDGVSVEAIAAALLAISGGGSGGGGDDDGEGRNGAGGGGSSDYGGQSFQEFPTMRDRKAAAKAMSSEADDLPATDATIARGAVTKCTAPMTTAAASTTTTEPSRRLLGRRTGDVGLSMVPQVGRADRVLRAVAEAHSLCIVAADTVYDSVLTEAFVKCAAALLSYHAAVRRLQYSAAGGGSGQGGGGDGDVDGSSRLIVSVEKRLVFTLRDMAVRAPAFDDFLKYVLVDGGSTEHAGAGSAAQQQAAVQDPVVQRPLFRGRRLDAAAVRQMLQYARNADLELWELRLL